MKNKHRPLILNQEHRNILIRLLPSLSSPMHSSMAASRQKIFSFISHSSSSSSSSTTHLKSFLNQTLRFKTSSSSSAFLSPLDHQNQHEFSTPCKFLGSWNSTNDPREAEAKLVQLRRDYAKQVKELRKEYLYEMDLQRQEKQRKDEAKREAIRVAKEERKAAKAVMAKARAAERMVVEEEFRQTLLKEQEQNLENWRLKEKTREEKKKEKNELLRRQSSTWVSDSDLEKKILEAIVDSTSL